MQIRIYRSGKKVAISTGTVTSHVSTRAAAEMAEAFAAVIEDIYRNKLNDGSSPVVIQVEDPEGYTA